MANSIEKFLSRKSNRPLLFLIIGFIFLYLRGRSMRNDVVDYVGGVGYVGGTGSNTGNNNNSGGGDDTGGDNGSYPGGTAPPVTPGLILENNPASLSQRVGTDFFEWIPTENVEVEIKPDGKVKLILPASKRTYNNSRDCYPFFISGSFHAFLSDADRAALLGDGLAIDEGETTIYIPYCDAASQEEVKNNKGRYFLRAELTGQSESRSGQPEAVIISRMPDTPSTGSGRVRIPGQISRASWLSVYHFLTYSLNSPVKNKLGTTRYYVNLDPTKQLGKQYTHLQYTRSWQDSMPTSTKWRNKQDVGKNSVQWLVQHEQYGKDYILFSEITENNQTGQPGYVKSEQVNAGMFNELKSRDSSVITPKDTRLYGDYFAPIHGGGLEVSFSQNTEGMLETLLSSQSEARKIVHDGVAHTSGYFAAGYYNHRNILHGAYLGNFLSYSPMGIYDLIFNLEKYNIAAPDRRVGLMTTPIQEGLGQDNVTDRGVWFRVPLGGGKDVMRASTVPVSFDSLFSLAFYAYLIGNETDIVCWDSNLKLNVNPNTFEQSWYGGFDAWKTRVKEGSSVVVYNPNNSNHPQKLAGADGSQFPELPQHAEGGLFAARQVIQHLTEENDYVSGGIYYNPFSVAVNGGATESGYRGGNNPSGPNSARLSARGYSNPGQNNVVKSGKDARKICLRLNGDSGNAIVCQNPWASISDVSLFNTAQGNFSVRGPKIHVFKP